MNTSRKRWSATVAVAGITAITGIGTTAAQAHPSSSSPAPVISIKQAHGIFTVSPSKKLQAGRVTFNFTAVKGDHTVQLVQLHKGYTTRQISKDVNAGLQHGDTAAIHRLDTEVTWLGGAESINGAHSAFSAVVPTGTVYAFDQNSNAVARFTVSGPAAAHPDVASSVVFKTIDGNFWNAPSSLPGAGWIKLRNNTNQPHFAVIQRVKESTTDQTVRDYIKSGNAEQQPPWLLKANTSSGAFSPGTTTAIRVHLPAGKYLLACFWPDAQTGMPHFMMGMWKLVRLT